MNILCKEIKSSQLRDELRTYLKDIHIRLGLVSSIDGSQLLTLLFNIDSGQLEIWNCRLESGSYPSVSLVVPQAHWFERGIMDLFGIEPEGHPRLKSVFTETALAGHIAPLRSQKMAGSDSVFATRNSQFMHVQGHGVYELPVGPVHAGIIEPGHFRLSCLGEVIENLELRLGFLHRGIEKRLTEVPWRKARFVAESAASDSSAANALAHAIAIESLFLAEVPPKAQYLRTMALEIERIAMHISDLGGMAVDLGFLGIAASLSRLRGTALRMAELLAGSRFLRWFICPGGVSGDPGSNVAAISEIAESFQSEVNALSRMFINNPAVFERLSGTGAVSSSLATEFGMVGVVARASNVLYDCRTCFQHGLYPDYAPEVSVEPGGDALARTRVRIKELETSFSILRHLCKQIPEGPICTEISDNLPSERYGIGIVESFRGELIHLIATGAAGEIKRYIIKDPSVNNWTGMAIASRGELIADFPVCNKSFSLSYSGHDL